MKYCIYSSILTADGSLWVDKYAPQSFTALLSPEKINREVLKALKKWDSFVFKTRSSTGKRAIETPVEWSCPYGSDSISSM